MIITDPTTKDYTFRKLEEDRTYVITMLVMDKTGVSKTAAVKFTTPLSQASAKAKEADKNSLVGISW